MKKNRAFMGAMIITSLILVSCGQNSNKQKELELEKRELALKEKELALAKKDSIEHSLIKPSIQKPINIKNELPFIGVKYFNFFEREEGFLNPTDSYSISISKEGLVIIKWELSPPYQQDLRVTDEDLILFKGQFNTIIKTDSQIYKIEADKISELDVKGNTIYSDSY